MSDNLDIAVLATGNELLSGEMSDTNTAAIAALLARYGLVLRRSLTVCDDSREIAQALRELADRHRVLIVSGGLGPTEDDLTAAAAALAIGCGLRKNDQAASLIAAHFRKMGRDMHPGNLKQSLLPEPCRVLVNNFGTAPGFALEIGSAQAFFLPGVPRELLGMLKEQVLPQLLKMTGSRLPRLETRLRTFGLAEPAVQELLTGLRLPAGVETGFGVSFPEVTVKLRSCDQAALQQAEAMTAKALEEILICSDERSTAQVTAEMLIQSGLSLSLAESCTGGLIAARLTEVPGASAFLERGAVCYATSAKQDWLNIPREILDDKGAVSSECASAMARGIRAAAGTDLGLAVTGIAGPAGGTPDKPVGTVYLALSDGDRVTVERLALGGSRERIRELTVATALGWLRAATRHRLEGS